MIDYKWFDVDSNFDVVEKCEKIAKSRYISNGGTLRYLDVVKDSDQVCCAIENGEIVGYIALVSKVKGSVYIMQYAVKEDFGQKGIGSCLLKNAMKKSLGSVLIADVRVYNVPSQKVFLKQDFRVFAQDENNIRYFKQIDENFDREV